MMPGNNTIVGPLDNIKKSAKKNNGLERAGIYFGIVSSSIMGYGIMTKNIYNFTKE